MKKGQLTQNKKKSRGKNNYHFIQLVYRIRTMEEVKQVQLSRLQMEALKVLLDNTHTAV